MININDLQALIAFAIANNKAGLIQSLNASGYSVSSVISDTDLYNFVEAIYNTRGLAILKDILNKVALDKSKLTQDQAKNLLIAYNNITVDPNAKFGDWIKEAGQTIGDFLSGTNTITQTGATSNQTVTSPISATTIIIIAGIAIVAIVILTIFVKK